VGNTRLLILSTAVIRCTIHDERIFAIIFFSD